MFTKLDYENFVKSEIVSQMPFAIDSFEVITASKSKKAFSVIIKILLNDNYIAEILTNNTIYDIVITNQVAARISIGTILNFHLHHSSGKFEFFSI